MGDKKGKKPSAEQMAKDFLAGGTSGAVSKTITAPIERVKLFIQTQDANPKIVSGEVPRYTSIGNVFSRVSKEQGMKAFWRGNFTNCVRYFPTQALNPWDKETTPLAIASKWAGAQFSVIMSGFVTYPFDTVRRRLQMESEVPLEKRLYKGSLHCAQRILKEEGTKAMFKGAGANILRGTGAALVLVFYGEAKNWMDRLNK